MPSYSFPKDITHQTVDGEVIAIHFGNGTYYSMRESAAVIWEALGAGTPSEALGSFFTTPPVEAAAQIEAFIGQLKEAGLVTEEPTAPAETAPSITPAAWSTPALEAFTDLSQLLLADPIHDVTEEAWPNLKDSSPA